MADHDYFSTLRKEYQRDNFDNFLTFQNFEFGIPSIHITGTNGKGSTATYISNIYTQAGYKVGLFTSPFLTYHNEMISIDGVNIPRTEISNYIEKYKEAFETFDLSEFEVMTFIAYTYFKEKNVDIAVIECGMGGRFDATNVITPVLSIITSVSIEHTIYLGNSVADIAYQKSGIIKDGVPVLIGKLDDEAKSVICEEANYHKSNVYQAEEPYDIEFSNDDGVRFSYSTFKLFHLKSNALYSVRDAAIALEAVRILRDTFKFSSQNLYQGLSFSFVPCRNERIHDNPLVILDGAHNPEGSSLLVESIEKMGICKDIHIVFASFKDKNISSMLSSLAYLTNDIRLTAFDHVRCRNEDDYFLYLGEYQFTPDHKKVIKELMQQYPDDVILVTGSLAFAGVVRKEFIDGEYK